MSSVLKEVPRTGSEEAALLAPVSRLSKDILAASNTMSKVEARYLVDAYYMMQEDRKRSGNQILALGQSQEPNEVLKWFFKQNELLENQVKRALDAYSATHPVGKWLRDIDGIGPVIAAGLLAHIDITKAPTAGHIWRFAGVDPTRKWMSREEGNKLSKECFKSESTPQEAVAKAAAQTNVAYANLLHVASHDRDGEEVKITETTLAKALSRRPWNAGLKTLLWKVGESFVKVCNKDTAYYGKIYLERKAQETLKNERGDFKEQAARALAEKNYGKTTDAYAAYIQGQLPKAHIHARSKRYAVKLFIAHLHEVWRKHEGLEVPLPYAIAFGGHAHVIPPPGVQPQPKG